MRALTPVNPEAFFVFPLFNPATRDPLEVPSGAAQFDRDGVVVWENPYLPFALMRRDGALPVVVAFRDGFAVMVGREPVFYSREIRPAAQFSHNLRPYCVATESVGY